MSYILWRGTHGCCQPRSQPALLPELAAQLSLSLLPCSCWTIQLKWPKFCPALAAWPNFPWHDMAFQRKQEYRTRRLHFPADTSCRTCWQLVPLNSTGSLLHSFSSWSIQRPTTVTPVRWYVFPSKGGLWSRMVGKALPLISRGDNMRSF